MRIEFLAPGCPSIREQYVDVIRRLLDFFDQCLDTGYLGAVGWDRDRLCPRSFVG